MRSQDEILKKIQETRKEDFLGTIIGDLIRHLQFDKAREFLKEDTDGAEWDRDTYKEPTKELIEKEIADYMPFAWDKANNCRGISASRSIEHFKTWCWLLGLEELEADLNNDEKYYWYGKPLLKQVCEHFGLDWKRWHDGTVGNDESSQYPNTELA